MAFWLKALDGSSVEVSTELKPSTVFTSDLMIRLGEGGRRQRFVAGPKDFARKTAFDPEIAVGMQLNEEYSLHGGSLELGSGNQPIGPDGVDYWEHSASGLKRRRPFRIGIWEGVGYSLYAHMYGGEPRDLLDAFFSVNLEEGQAGITCLPRDPLSTPISDAASVMQVMPTIGLFYIRQMTAATAKELPRQSGADVFGGELFLAKSERSGAYFVLANDTSVTHIVPDSPTDLQSALESIESLSVTWRHAA